VLGDRLPDRATEADAGDVASGESGLRGRVPDRFACGRGRAGGHVGIGGAGGLGVGGAGGLGIEDAGAADRAQLTACAAELADAAAAGRTALGPRERRVRGARR
jgi:hypothetical protein